MELNIVERASDNTIGTPKNTLKPHLQRQWVIPPDANAAFVARTWKMCWRFIIGRTIQELSLWSAWTRHQSN